MNPANLALLGGLGTITLIWLAVGGTFCALTLRREMNDDIGVGMTVFAVIASAAIGIATGATFYFIHG